MPELPEVETTRRSIAPHLVGAQIAAVHLGKPLRWPLGCAPEHLVGRCVREVNRRGKYLLIELDAGVLMLHLGMSGSLQLAAQLAPRSTHDHFDLLTSHGTLRLHDPRRFGAVVYVDTLQEPRARKLLDHLGVEPLQAGFEPAGFHRALQHRRSSIKQVLLAGDIVVGVGNIYACEALFMAGIHPSALAHALTRQQVKRLHASIVTVLQRAIDVGGSTLRNFSNAQGQSGHFQQEVMVYARAGQPCRVCQTPIQTLRQGQRSSFFCPRCQRG